MQKFTGVNLPEYKQCRVLSYVGGSTWLGTPWGVFFVVPGSPVEVRQQLESGTEVMAEVLPIHAG